MSDIAPGVAHTPASSRPLRAWLRAPLHGGERIYRSTRIAFTALLVWLRYRAPRWKDRLQGIDPSARDQRPLHQANADMVFRTAVGMRGLLVKMCQVIGTRSDVFPPEYVQTLSRCQDELPARPWGLIRRVVEEELGQPIEAVFSAFEQEPVAAASLAQVHFAVLKDGGEVAIKVQYPDIDHIVQTDLAASRWVAQVYQHFDREPLDFIPLLDELSRHLRMELDFRREVANADRIRELFEDDPSVRIPQIYPEWSGRRIICMERVAGARVNDPEGLRAAGVDLDGYMTRLMRIFNRMILAYGFFHADPHPGNFFVNADQDGRPIFTLLDFGLAKELPEGFGMGIFELMFSMMTFNESAMLRAFRELGFETQAEDDDSLLLIARRMISQSDSGSFQGEFTEEMTDEMFDAIRENPIVQVPTDFVLVARAFSLLSGIAHTLGQRANALEAMGPG